MTSNTSTSNTSPAGAQRAATGTTPGTPAAAAAPDEKQAARPKRSLRDRTRRVGQRTVRRTETVTVRAKRDPEEGEGTEPIEEILTFEVRPMMGGARSRLIDEGYTEVRTIVGNESRVRMVPILDKYFAIAIMESTYDPETGERVWPNKEDMAAVIDLDPKVHDELVAAAIRVNGLSKEAREALGED